MRIYSDNTRKELTAVICNQCKKELKVKNGMLQDACFHGEAQFGYFSNKDGQKHFFDLCEECYDKMIKEFAISVEKEEVTELL